MQRFGAHHLTVTCRLSLSPLPCSQINGEEQSHELNNVFLEKGLEGDTRNGHLVIEARDGGSSLNYMQYSPAR
jgi:hypothetical protein